MAATLKALGSCWEIASEAAHPLRPLQTNILAIYPTQLTFFWCSSWLWNHTYARGRGSFFSACASCFDHLTCKFREDGVVANYWPDQSKIGSSSSELHSIAPHKKKPTEIWTELKSAVVQKTYIMFARVRQKYPKCSECFVGKWETKLLPYKEML